MADYSLRSSTEKKRFCFPLVGKTFYLDSLGPEKEELVPKITILGGNIEDHFTSKWVTHIVTDLSNTKKEIIEHAERSKKAIYEWKKFSTFVTKRYKDIKDGDTGPLITPQTSSHAISPIPNPITSTPHIKLITPNRRSPQIKKFEPDEQGRSTIPQIRFHSPPGQSPFLPESECDRINEFLRKSSSTGKRKFVESEVQDKGGYCENCSVRFESYNQHVETSVHQEFEQNAINFAELDNYLYSMDSGIEPGDMTTS